MLNINLVNRTNSMSTALRLSLLILFCAVSTATRAVAQSATKDSTDCVEAKAQVTRLETKLNDWPALGRYHELNMSVAAPAKNEARVVFMGDSITDSWNKPGNGGFFPGKPYLDRGISGQTTSQMLIRFRPDVIALKPKVVVILAGTNDIAGNTGPETLEEIEGNLESMAQLAKVNNISVVLSSVMPVCDYIRPQTAKRPPQQIVTLNAWMKAYCASHQCVYLDYYSAMVDDHNMLKKELTFDGLHPNDAGYAVMSPLASQAVEAALSPSRSQQ